MKKIKILSPTNGKVFRIQNLKDGVFSEGMLGEGIYILPEDGNFFPVFESQTIEQIFHTKHAVILKSNDVFILLHVGIDTVNLNGEPFRYLVDEKAKLTNKTKFLDVDLLKIKENKLSLATPILVDMNESKGINKLDINITDGQEVKTGDLIMTIFIEEVDQKEKLEKELLNFKDKYYQAAQEIYDLVGTKANYTRVYNCVTRLRFLIKDKDKVNISKIKNIDIVKGTNWNGDELQIIIGADVQRLKDAFENYYNDLKLGRLKKQKNDDFKVSRNFKKTFFGAVTGIVTPVIPVLLIFGMTQGIRALLIQFGVIVSKPTQDDYVSWIYNSISEVGLTFIFVAFIWSTVKYFKGNEVVGVFIGLALCNPFLLKNGFEWVWFSVDWKIIGNPINIGITNYVNSVLPAIVAGILYIYFDKWIKTWMPAVIDIVFRHTLGFVFTILSMLFIFGPLSKVIELLLAVVVISLGNIPLGIGVGLFSLLFQPLVITGMHQVVQSVLRAQLAANPPLLLYTGIIISTWAQIGAAMGVAIATKRQGVRQTATGSLPAALLGGITEPIIYGVNLIRVKPFIAGISAAGVGGILSGILKVGRWGQAPGGIFHILGYTQGGTWNIINYCIVMTITAVLGIIFTLALYSDRDKEKNLIKKINNNIFKLTSKEHKDEVKNLNHRITKIIDSVLIKKINEAEKIVIKSQNIELILKKIDEQENKEKKKLSKIVIKLNEKNNSEKIDNLLNNFDAYKYENKRIQINNELTEIEIKKIELLKEINKEIKIKFEKIKHELDSLKDIQYLKEKGIENNYWNAINSMQITYEIVQPIIPEVNFKEIVKLQKQG